MATLVQDTRFELAGRELVVLSEARDHELLCHDGELWITFDGDRRDLILGPGQSHRIDSRAPVVVSALKASTVSVRYAQPGDARTRSGRRLLFSLLHWEFPPLAAFPSPLIR